MKQKPIHIEKYDFQAWEKEHKPFTMILTNVIQSTPPSRLRETFLWIYLESLPETWKPNKQHLMSHFGISERTYDRWMSWLNAVGLIEYRQNRGLNGEFGKGTLVVLNGSKFNPEAECNGTVKIGGTVVNKKNSKVIHINEANRDAKFGGSVKPPTSPASIDDPAISPNRQKTEPRSNGGHINTTNKKHKEKKKTNNVAVSVFADALSVKDHIERVVANRKDQGDLDDDVANQGVYYAFESNPDHSFDSVNKRVNIFLKKVREGKWLIPQGYKGITSQSIREKEETANKEKQQQYAEEAQAFKNIIQSVAGGEGLKGFRDLVKKLRANVDANA